MSKMKNFKRRFSLSVPRTETIEESLAEFTEQFNQLHNRRNEGEGSGALSPPLPSPAFLHTSTTGPGGEGQRSGWTGLPTPPPSWGRGWEGS